MKIKQILFPTDFSPCSDHALRHALSLAELYGASLSIVHVTLPLEHDTRAQSGISDLDRAQEEIDRLSEGQMRAAEEKRTYKEIHIEQTTIRGISAAPALLEFAAEHDVDLIVMGTHGRRGLNHFMLGSVAAEVVRLSPIPVFSVRESRNVMYPLHFGQILVPVDFSPFSRDAVSTAKHLAHDFGATLRLLHVIEEIIHPSFYLTGQTPLSSWLPDVEAAALKEMKILFEKADGPEIPVEYHVKQARAAIGIADFVKRNGIDLVVMASHGLTGVTHFLLGSVTERLLRMASCPLFVLKSFGSRHSRETEPLLGSEKTQ